jgi:hypothetical protein
MPAPILIPATVVARVSNIPSLSLRAATSGSLVGMGEECPNRTLVVTSSWASVATVSMASDRPSQIEPALGAGLFITALLFQWPLIGHPKSNREKYWDSVEDHNWFQWPLIGHPKSNLLLPALGMAEE